MFKRFLISSVLLTAFVFGKAGGEDSGVWGRFHIQERSLLSFDTLILQFPNSHAAIKVDGDKISSVKVSISYEGSTVDVGYEAEREKEIKKNLSGELVQVRTSDYLGKEIYFWQVGFHPEITFESKGIIENGESGNFAVKGTLKINGVDNHGVALDLHPDGTSGGDVYSVEGHFCFDFDQQRIVEGATSCDGANNSWLQLDFSIPAELDLAGVSVSSSLGYR